MNVLDEKACLPSIITCRLLNGYPNDYWGWGCEDDDMYKRVRHYNLTLTRYSEDIAR